MESKIGLIVFTSSIKRCIRKFYVVLLHWRQENEPECSARETFYNAYKNLCYMTFTMLFPLYIVNFLLKNRVRFFLKVMLHGDADLSFA